MYFDLEWLYDIFFLEAWHLFSIIISIFFLVFIWLNSRKTALFYHYLVLQVILLNWLVSKVLKTLAPTEGLKWAFIVAQYFTVAFLGSAVLMFSYLYTRGKPIPLKAGILLNIPPLVFFIIIATNARHHLFYSTYDFLGDTFGPAFYAYSAVTYLYIAVALFWLAVWFGRRPKSGGLEGRLLTAGIIIPLFVNAMYISRLVKFRFDITPVSFNLSLLLFAYAVYRHSFLDVVPLGIQAAFNGLREGVLLAEKGGRVIDYNPALRRMFNSPAVIDQETMKRLALGFELDAPLAGPRHADVVVKGCEARHLTVCSQPLPGEKNMPVYLHVFYDNTEYLALIKELQEKNEELLLANERLKTYTAELSRLAVMEERNRLAGEIHDILGHSLVLMLNILESSRLLMESNPEKALALAGQALAVAYRAINELQSAVCMEADVNSRPAKMLKNDLKQLAGQYQAAGMAVNLEFKGEKSALPTGHYRVAMRVCQEALTNALKHGAAREATVFVRINHEALNIYVVDDGKGCKNLVKGNGLTGMEQRVAKLKGTFSCGAAGEKGFIVHAAIPW